MKCLLLVLSQSNLTFIDDLSPVNTPTGQSRRFVISNTNNNNKQQNPLAINHKRISTITAASSQLTTRLKVIMEGSEHAK